MSDRESTRKSAQTGEFLDLCDRCYKTIEDQVPSIENQLLSDQTDDLDQISAKLLEKYEQEHK